MTSSEAAVPPLGAPFSDLRVVELSSGIAGAYCTKILADAGADVVKIEAPSGDPLRRWSASGATVADGDDGALFSHLAASKRSVVVEPGPGLETLHEWLRVSDVVVWSRGSALAGAAGCSPADLLAAHPHLVVASITPFGLDGPWSDRPATEFTLQAWSGGIIGLGRGAPDRAPIHVGGQIGEWLTGVYTAAAVLAALRRGGADGAPDGETIDVSMLEVMASCLTYYPVTFQQQLGYPMRSKRFVPTPGVAAASDGLVGLGCGTGQQWLDVCAMVGHPEWTAERKYFLDRTELAPTIDAWVGEHTVAEVTDLASAFRIPNAPIVHGANAAGIDHFVERGTFVDNPRDGVRNPGLPYRLSSTVLPPRRPAPALGEHTADVALERVPSDPAQPATPGSGTERFTLPFEGLRVLDMTAFWAGPLVGHILALLGAEVIHVESAKRPDGVRLVGGVPQTEPQYWERGPIFSALNTNKKSLTVDFADPRGVELVKEIAATCDVVVENYTPRVLDGAGLDYESLRAVKPDLVMVRMPGFGLDGPWRELAAFAFVIEDASGLTWLTGHPDLLPIEPYGVGDPNAGLHALVGLLVALRHRDRTGEGSLVEAAMVDAALNIAAEQVIEHSA
ncbi:MAG: CoA transferase, partial [Ilumatobacteraceae bacterium]